MLELVWLFAGVLTGGVAAWLISFYKFKSESKGNDTALRVYEQRIRDLNQEIDYHKDELKRERDKVITLSNRLAGSQSEFRHMEDRLKEQKEEIENIQQKFAAEFRNLANQIFDEKSRKFTDLNKVNLESLLKPLGERINQFEKKVESSNQTSLEWHAALREQISALKDQNLQITKEAVNLTKALKGDSKTMGNWGEVILESILEKSGLEKGREYFVQERYKTEEGKRIQPDVIVKLPENKNIIVDSKVSLVAYEKYVNETEGKDIHLKSHLQSIRNHLKNLDVKEYQKLYHLEGLDFVLMFIPIEPAFSLAIQQDPAIFTDAYDHNIVMVSPATLIATLRTIANIWRNEYQNRNAQEIARQGGDLYDKFVSFIEDLKGIGKQIDGTQKTYVDAMKKLVDGRGNLISRAERIRDLGAKTSKTMDSRLIERAKEREG
jgi:DNA recombination protein RmuC